VITLAAGLSDATTAIDALKKTLESTQDAGLRQAAQTAINEVQARAAYLTAWKASGPFRQAGKDYAALFDIPFAPESGQSADWRPLPPGTDASRPGVLDLLKALGGEQCVGYARTSVYCDQDTPARLELGSDDGFKIWINGQVVLANNIARPLTAGSDKANVTLKAGWNPILLKVTQNNQGWEFCVRLLRPDGSLIPGLKSDPNR